MWNWEIILAIVVLVLVIVYFFSPFYESKRLSSFMGALGVISVIILLLGYSQSQRQAQVNTNQLGLQQIQTAKQNFTDTTNKYWVETEQMFLSNWPVLARLYSQIWASQGKVLKLPTLTPNQAAEQPYAENQAAQRLFQIIENIIITQGQQIERGRGWWDIFNSWAKSKVFQSVWKNSKSFYNPLTQKFIKALIAGDDKKSLKLFTRLVMV
jgi:hypothetical protein